MAMESNTAAMPKIQKTFFLRSAKSLTKKRAHGEFTPEDKKSNILDTQNTPAVMPNILGQHCKNQNPHQKIQGKPRPKPKACARCI